MSRTLKQNEQILAWAEEGALTPLQMESLRALESMSPDRTQWLTLLERVSLTAGVLLLSVGVIFFFAWNWAEMHRFAKFGLGLTALTGFTALGLFARPASALFRAALLGCCVTTGAVLALVGQIYQTGADIWQLFAIWALLTLPWAWLSGSSACWGLSWAVGNLALVSFFAQSQWQGLFAGIPGYLALLVLAVGNGALMLIFECFGHALLTMPGRAVQRLACFGMLTALGSGAAGSSWDGAYLPLLFIFVLMAAVMLVFYHRQRRDLTILAMLLVWLIVCGTSALIRLTIEVGETFLLVNVVALFVLISSAMAAVWLTRLSREAQA